jgi:hypothetical protein
LDASKSHVVKLQYAFTGLWRITAIFKGASYELEHCSTPNHKDKKHASDLSPHPLELIPFEPVNGSNTQYGQLHKPIQASPYKEAGIKGFKPLLPFKVPANYLMTVSALAFHWPSLSELNVDIAPFQWLSEDERHLYLSGDTILNLLVMYTAPPPAAPTYPPPAIPELTILPDQSFKALTGYKVCKWRTVQVAFKESMSSYPSCLQDGHFLLNFFICHPSNSRVNTINQRYWLQYHTLSKLQSPLATTDTHPIFPSDTSVNYAQCHKLCPFQKWLNLIHLDTFIHGPYEFASVHGR